LFCVAENHRKIQEAVTNRKQEVSNLSYAIEDIQIAMRDQEKLILDKSNLLAESNCSLIVSCSASFPVPYDLIRASNAASKRRCRAEEGKPREAETRV